MEVAAGAHAMGNNVILEKEDSQVYFTPFAPLKANETICIGVYQLKNDLKFMTLTMPTGNQFYQVIEERSKKMFIHGC
jgi:hypothetical protein